MTKQIVSDGWAVVSVREPLYKIIVDYVEKNPSYGNPSRFIDDALRKRLEKLGVMN